MNGTGEKTPERWNIGQNYPNPFNGTTVIPFSIPNDDNISIQFFDTLGRLVNEKNLGMKQRGTHSVVWNARDTRGNALASGAYLYVVKGSSSISTKKMLLIQ